MRFYGYLIEKRGKLQRKVIVELWENAKRAKFGCYEGVLTSVNGFQAFQEPSIQGKCGISTKEPKLHD